VKKLLNSQACITVQTKEVPSSRRRQTCRAEKHSHSIKQHIVFFLRATKCGKNLENDTLKGDVLPTITEPQVTEEIITEINSAFDDYYSVYVLNDDVTTFEAVISALVELFDHSVERADELAWIVHRQGKAEVAVLPKEEAEQGVKDLHARQIQAECWPA